MNLQKDYPDQDVVKELQRRNRRVEEWFYRKAKSYFMAKFNEVFFDQDRKQEIFQESFLRLWTDITDGTIGIEDDVVCRQRADGCFRPMTCSLTTFLMAIARNEYREVLRNSKEVLFPEFFEDANGAEVMETAWNSKDDEEVMKSRIVNRCIQRMSPSCIEILTLSVFEEKSLDEIMAIRQNSSKDGLKSAKHKCMNTLRERITEEFKRYHLTA
ncbi:MAG: sigma-70 family RNA polymerase sigma factor [Bacteroidaceae bacterium]|nr:sigma-70 family RNA polymerase sigma factor [Bacteroidaceae bacterium]